MFLSMSTEATISLIRMSTDTISLTRQCPDTGQTTSNIPRLKRVGPIKNKGDIDYLFDRDSNYESKRVAFCPESGTAVGDIWSRCGREAAWFTEQPLIKVIDAGSDAEIPQICFREESLRREVQNILMNGTDCM